jgi:hypothetical protein
MSIDKRKADIASRHGLPLNSFCAKNDDGKDNKRLCIWVTEEIVTKLRHAASFMKLTAQEMVAELVAEHVAPAPETSAKPRKNSLTPTSRLTDMGLTREQVDPDFKGSELDFVRTYGRVNLQTKAEIEADKAAVRGNALSVMMRDAVAKAPSDVSANDVRVWIEHGRMLGGRRDETFVERARDFLSMAEKIRPVLAEVIAENSGA